MKILIKNKHWKLNEDYNIDKILYLLIDRPNIVNCYYYFVWHNNEGWHRNYDLPAFIEARNFYNVEWYKYNKIHRENNKPAVICEDGIKKYHINGNFIKEIK